MNFDTGIDCEPFLFWGCARFYKEGENGKLQRRQTRERNKELQGGKKKINNSHETAKTPANTMHLSSIWFAIRIGVGLKVVIFQCI